MSVVVLMAVSFSLVFFIYQRSIELNFEKLELISNQPAIPESNLVDYLEAEFAAGGWTALQNYDQTAKVTGAAFVLLDSTEKVRASPWGTAVDVTRNPNNGYNLQVNETTGGKVASLVTLEGLPASQLHLPDGSVFASLVALPAQLSGSGADEFASTVARTVLRAALIIFLATLIFTMLFVRYFLTPVNRLKEAAGKFHTSGELDPVNIRAAGELGELAEAFNAVGDSLRKTEKLRKNIIADVAHELRTPVTNLSGRIEAVQAGIIQPDGEFINTMESETQLLARLINDLQQLALSDAGQIRLEKQPVRMCTEVTDIFRKMTWSDAAMLDNQIPDDMELMVDTARFHQILGNIFANAYAHRRSGLEICVTAQEKSDEIRLAIADNGPGIPAEQLPFVFDRLYRVEKSRSRSPGGAGLGLAIVKSLVEAHGGEVTIASEMGNGVCVNLVFPNVSGTTA